jgi:hypothetical protein
MSRRLKIAVVLAVSALAVAALVPLAWHRFEAWVVGIHQESVTRSLADWEREVSPIRTKDEAIRAVDMLRYVQDYYVPRPGYRSDSATEAALQAQRQQTSNTIVSALEEFIGERYGLDVDQWETWRDRQRRP